MDEYTAALESIGDSILLWADPEGQFTGYTKGWFLTDFPSAFNIALAYFLFVVVGSQVMKFLPAIDPYPIKFFYNVSQIMICAYMTIEASLLAYRNGYTITPCVGYNRDDPALANLLWLFYVTKVWDLGYYFYRLGEKMETALLPACLSSYYHLSVLLAELERILRW